MHRLTKLVVAAGALLMWFPAYGGGGHHGHHGHGHHGHHGHHGDRNFTFVEESDRLPADTSPEGTSTTGVDLVDLDGDGDLDIFFSQGTAGPSGRPNRVLINDGDGNFTDGTQAWLGTVNNNANTAKAAFADFDGDGDVDALLANLGQEQLLINQGDHFFEAPPGQIPITFGLDVSANAEAADVDDDGDLDVLISNENPFPGGTGAQNRLYLNNGAAVFVEAPLPPAIDQTVSQLTGDIDGDGDLDIVVLNRGQERVLIGDGSGAFVDETAGRIPLIDPTIPNVSSARGGGLADLDDDGDLDLIIGNSRSEPVEYYKNDGDGFFTPAAFPYVPLTTDTITGLLLADLDEDGDLDVYLPNAGVFDAAPGGHGFFGGPDYYFSNNGHGRFKDETAKHFDPPDDPTTGAAFADIDDDGDLDLVVGNTDDNVPGDSGGERVFIQRHRCGWFWN